MKKILLLVALAFCLVSSYAQDKMFKNVSTTFLLNQFENAKNEIEKVMADPKAQAKAEGWLWKARVYAELYADPNLSEKYTDAGTIALESFKKYEAMDKDYKLIAEPLVTWRSADLIYVTSFNKGRVLFSNKKWEEAFNVFTRAEYIGDVFTKKNLRQNGATIDTFVVLYTAYSAQNAKKADEAAYYYAKLADQKISGEDYKDIYTYLLIYAADKNDKEKFYKYFTVAKEVYPKEEWEDYEFDFFSKNLTTTQKSEMYDKEDAAGTLSARKYLLYGQMFSEIGRDDKALDSTAKESYHKKATDAFMKAFNKDNTLGIAAFNAGVNYYNDFNLYDERIGNNRRAMQELNSNKVVEKDPKKKAAADAALKTKIDALKKANADLEIPLTQNLDAAITWLEKSFVSLKAQEPKDKTTKNCLNNAVKWLANCFQYKREKVKGKDAKAYDMLDAKYKEYDALYDKF